MKRFQLIWGRAFLVANSGVFVIKNCLSDFYKFMTFLQTDMTAVLGSYHLPQNPLKLKRIEAFKLAWVVAMEKTKRVGIHFLTRPP